jgi:hypothetical protein
MAETRSVKRYDRIFDRFSSYVNGHLSYQKYDAYNIRFDCLKSVIDNFEAQ